MGAPTINDPPESSPGVELLTAGSKFARYEIVRCIGVGGMGAVFEATHSLLRKRVALKALHATLGRSDASRARFLREAETVARIRHPNVVDITDVGVERSIPFLVMEFLEGEDVAAVLEREGRLDVTRTIDMLLPAVAGLCAVHRLGIVHRDIKPENIFLAVDTLGTVVPKLVDFGVSKDLDASGAEGAPLRHTVAGTPYYMSPEQARGAATLDARADQYAMAVVLYQCLADARPFFSDSLLELLHTIDAGEYVPLQKRVAEVPEALAAVIERAMSRRLEDRFPTTEAFGQALSEFASEAVKNACARDFSAERRSALPAAQRRWSEAERERQSAPTRPGDALLPAGLFGSRAEPRASTFGSRAEPRASTPTLEERPSRLSGVRARDTEPEQGPLPAHSRRAFVLAFGVTLILLLVLGAFLYKVPTPSPVKVTVEPPHASRKGAEPPAPHAAPPEVGAGELAAPTEPDLTRARGQPREQHDKDGERPRAKPRRQEGPSPVQPAQVDIQLSR